MYLLGIHDGHNASAALMKDGEIIDAIQEERFNKIKNFGGFPENSISYILKKNDLNIDQIDRFVFGGLLSNAEGQENRERVLTKYKNNFYNKHSFFQFLKKKLIIFFPQFLLNIRKNLKIKLLQKKRIKNLLSKGVSLKKIDFIDHHLCHASTAAYGSGNKKDTLVITLDSTGDFSSGSVSIFKNHNLKKILDIHSDDSIGRLYSYVTYYLGMVPLEHEYKIMGLAPYAENSIRSKEISKFFRDMYYFENEISFKISKKIWSAKNLGKYILLGLKQKRFDNISSGLQIFLEEFICEWVEKLVKHTNIKDLALSGGVFMNVKLNKKISELKCIDSVFVYPSCGDETNSIGALYRKYFELTAKLPKKLNSFYLGNSYKNEDIKEQYEKFKFQNFETKICYYENIEEKIAKLIFENNIVARFKGRMEFGARSLGNRAILCNPKDISLVKEINYIIKNRDFWMPFAPSLVNDKKYLVNPKNVNMEFMMIATNFKSDFENLFIGVSHPYDSSCRPNVVNENSNYDYYKLIKYYEDLSKHSIILNTSFNLHGLPIVCEPSDAFYVLDNSGLKYLAIENYLIEKT